MAKTTQFTSPSATYSSNSLTTGTILLDRYQIKRQIGGGGQGAVYQGRDLNFPEANRLVAIKEMLITTDDVSLRASTMKAFQREANLLATLSHPTIPKIYDFFHRDDRAYLVMEYINGNNLEEVLLKTKYIPMKKIIEWAIELCDVLSYLHSHKPEPIIFRDMKPANIMIDNLGKVRLVDFGIAKIFISGKKQTTIGTEGYSAPEQYKGNANPASDIFSLGATMHHVITRKDPRLEPPFSFHERQLRDFNEEASPELQLIIDTSVQPKAEERYNFCSDMKEALEQVRYSTYTTRLNANRTASALAPAQHSDITHNPNGAQTAVGEHTMPMDENGTMQPLWTFRAEDEIRSQPAAIAREAVFFGSYDTNLWAVNFSDGQLLWKFPTHGGIVTTPLINPQTHKVSFGSEDGKYYCLDTRSGSVNWVFETKEKIRGSGAASHGYIFFGGDDGKLYALVEQNGRVTWTYDAASPIRTKPCVTASRVIFGTESGDVVGLALNGQLKWSYRAKREILSAPVADENQTCYVGSYDFFLYAIDTDNGFSHWRFRTGGPIIGSPAVDDETVYTASADGKLYAVNTQTGRERWSFDAESPIVASPTIYKGTIYIGDTGGSMHAINSRNGRELWKYTPARLDRGSSAITGGAVAMNDMLMFGTLDYRLHALPIFDVAYK